MGVAGVSDQLPPEDALAFFLSEAYQASLLREEDRSVVCRLILVDPDELGDHAGPPNGLHVLRFHEERPMREQEIRRLSPTATFYRSLIGVRWDLNQGFLIWGIINSGSRHEAGTRHRAAYRLTRDYPECMVTVVSKDGSVRYVGNRNRKVVYWDILSI